MCGGRQRPRRAHHAHRDRLDHRPARGHRQRPRRGAAHGGTALAGRAPRRFHGPRRRPDRHAAARPGFPARPAARRGRPLGGQDRRGHQAPACRLRRDSAGVSLCSAGRRDRCRQPDRARRPLALAGGDRRVPARAGGRRSGRRPRSRALVAALLADAAAAPVDRDGHAGHRGGAHRGRRHPGRRIHHCPPAPGASGHRCAEPRPWRFRAAAARAAGLHPERHHLGGRLHPRTRVRVRHRDGGGADRLRARCDADVPDARRAASWNPANWSRAGCPRYSPGRSGLADRRDARCPVPGRDLRRDRHGQDRPHAAARGGAAVGFRGGHGGWPGHRPCGGVRGRPARRRPPGRGRPVRPAGRPGGGARDRRDRGAGGRRRELADPAPGLTSGFAPRGGGRAGRGGSLGGG